MNKKKIITGACVALAAYALIYVCVYLFADRTNEFWLTATNMRALKGHDHVAFKLFGPLHLAELGLTLLASLISCHFYKKCDEDKRRRVLIVLAVAIAAEEIVKDVVFLATGQFDMETLPFHLCGVNIFIALWFAFRRNDYIAEFLYAFGLAGTWVALITTSWQACPLYNFSHMHSVFFHGLLAVFCSLVIADGHRPHIWNIWKVFVILALTIIPAIIFDVAFDTNFFFLKRTENNPVLEALASNFGKFYLLGLAGLAVIGVLIMYIPWIIRDIVIACKKS